MNSIFHIHWKLRKGRSAVMVLQPVTDIFLDDLPEETTDSEARDIALDQFKEERRKLGTATSEYIIIEIEKG